MGIIRKAAAVTVAAGVAFSLMGFAPTPKSDVYQDTYLFSEDGSQAVAKVAGVKYHVAIVPTVKVAHLYDAHPPYRAAIAVLDGKGRIRYFADMNEAHGVNAFGAYLESKRSYGSLHALKTKLDRLIEKAPAHY